MTIHLSLPVHNNVAVLIGDIYIHCGIRFNPKSPPETSIEKVSVDQFNLRLQEMGHRIAAEMSSKVENELRGDTICPNK